MATVKMIREEEAVGQVKEICDEIKVQLGIDFVPNLCRVMAQKPEYLEANWNKVKAVMVSERNEGSDRCRSISKTKTWFLKLQGCALP